MQLEAVKAAYRRYAGFYDALFGPVLQPGRRAVVQAMGCRPGDRVLEVGVGTGISLPMYPDDVSVTGIDVSREMLEKARMRVRRRGLKNVAALIEMDAEAMDFPDASFHKVVAMYVVSVVQNPGRLLQELHRVCRHDGEIFIVGHFRSSNAVVRTFERALARFSSQIGFRTDLVLEELIPGFDGEAARVNLLCKVLRLRNGYARGVSHPGSAGPARDHLS